MKTLWDKTRGGPLLLDDFLGFWSDKATRLKEAVFSDDWIGILYQRCSYLCRNQTLLGSEDDKLHQSKTILATAALLQVRDAGDISDLVQARQEETADTKLLREKYTLFFNGFDSTHCKESMQAHVQASGFDEADAESAIDIIVRTEDGVHSDEVSLPPNELKRHPTLCC